jgi:catechol 2,3-dioxygenase-like lactoylglutathione lyase family enzyme
MIGTEFAGDDVEPAGATALFELRNGLLLSLYPRAELAKDAKVALGLPKTGEFSIGHTVASKAEVDTLLTRAQAAGATLTDRPHDRPWGIYRLLSRSRWTPLGDPLEPTARLLARVVALSRINDQVGGGRCSWQDS